MYERSYGKSKVPAENATGNKWASTSEAVSESSIQKIQNGSRN